MRVWWGRNCQISTRKELPERCRRFISTTIPPLPSPPGWVKATWSFSNSAPRKLLPLLRRQFGISSKPSLAPVPWWCKECWLLLHSCFFISHRHLTRRRGDCVSPTVYIIRPNLTLPVEQLVSSLALPAGRKGCKSSWPPLAKPYVALRLQGSCGRFLFLPPSLVFSPVCLLLLLASIAFIHGQLLEDGRQPRLPLAVPSRCAVGAKNRSE